MKKLILLAIVGTLSGCASTANQMYYDTAKSISKDNTVAQTACWAAIGEIAKGGDAGARVGAIALAEKCKNDSVKIAPPQRNWFGF